MATCDLDAMIGAHLVAGDEPAIRAVYDRLVEKCGAERASRSWWAYFGSRDAAET